MNVKASGGFEARHYGMIRKSVKRFSEKIMPKLNAQAPTMRAFTRYCPPLKAVRGGEGACSGGCVLAAHRDDVTHSGVPQTVEFSGRLARRHGRRLKAGAVGPAIE